MRHQALAELASFVRRLIFRAAARLWMTPFFEALSMTDWAVVNLTFVSSADASPTDDRISLTILLTLVFVALFRKRRISFWRARLTADL
jgi:hypothetical protein